MRRCILITHSSTSTIEAGDTYLQKAPWLLPAAWVHRILQKRDIFGKCLQEIQNIAISDTEESLKVKRIYQEIGLKIDAL